MRMTFDADTPKGDQIKRAGKRKQVGRKHNQQPSSRKTEQQKQGQRKWIVFQAGKDRKRRDEIRAYWAGKRETHP